MAHRRQQRLHSATGFLLTKSNHGYWMWQLHTSSRHNESIDIVIWADSSDEHADQNVNWEVVDAEGSVTHRGHARSVRAAVANLSAMDFLR